MFAIYLGFDSFKDYIIKKEITAKINNEEVVDIENEPTEITKSQIVQLLKKNDFGKAIELLEVQIQLYYSDYFQSILNISGDLLRLENMEIDMELTQEQVEVKYNLLRKRLMKLTKRVFD